MSLRSFQFLEQGSPASSDAPWDRVLFESENFVAIPTVGALVKGWMLIVPRHYHLCFGALDTSLLTELLAFRKVVADSVSRAFGQVALFEHGPSSISQAPGCGVDYAHLHILPTNLDLVTAASATLGERLKWQSVRSLEAARCYFDEGNPYLYVEQPLGNARIATHPKFPSQLIRKAVATHLGIPDQFDWRKFPMLPNVLATIDELSPSTAFTELLPVT